MGKKNQSGGREVDALARTNKGGNSNSFDDHMAKEDRLRKDREKQMQGHMNDVRARKGLPKAKPMVEPLVGDDTAVKTLERDEDDRELLVVDDHRLILGLRVYDRLPDGGPVGRSATGDEFVATHRRIRRERKNYRELDGSMVQVGKVFGVRKGEYMKTLDKHMKTRSETRRRAPGVIKSIMVRLMPHEAENSTSWLATKPAAVEAAMDRTVAEFSAATGCEILTAAVHRMSNMDLHIHVQYTMVIGGLESKWMLGRGGLKAWKKKAAMLAREALAADGIEDPNPSAVGAKKKRLVAEGKLEPKPVAKIEYRKAKGLRSLRDDAILGYSFRQKLNLVRLAEEAGEAALANRVISHNDGRGRFRPIAKSADADLEKKYLDLWLERVWRQSVKAELPPETLEKLVVAGVAAAQDYADYGTVMVEETHIARRKEELEQSASESAMLADYENELFRREVEDAALQKIAAMEEQVAAFRKSAEEAEKSVAAAKNAEAAALQQVRTMEKQVDQFIKSADEEAKQSIEEAKRAEAAAERRAAAMEKQVEQIAESTKDTAAILTLIQAILDDPAVRALLESIEALWEKIVELGGRVGLHLGEPQLKKEIKPNDKGKTLE